MKVHMKQLGMPSCEDMSLLVSQRHDRALSARERGKVALHLAMCRYCLRFQRHLRVLRATVEQDKR